MSLLLKHFKHYQNFKGFLLRTDKLSIKLIEMGEGQRNNKVRIVNKMQYESVTIISEGHWYSNDHIV